MIKFESCLKYKLSAKAICMGEWRGEGREVGTARSEQRVSEEGSQERAWGRWGKVVKGWWGRGWRDLARCTGTTLRRRAPA